MNICDQCWSQELTWDFIEVTHDNHVHKKTSTITYTVNSSISKIEDANETIFIDYANYTFYRYNRLTKSCITFPLTSEKTNGSPDTPEYLKNRSISLAGSLRILNTTEHTTIGTYNCSLKRIMFGADLAKIQMLASPVISEFNQTFTESMSSYSVSNEVAGFTPLLNIARKHKNVLKNNPLLRQIDIVGLLEILGGFPVQISRQSGSKQSVTTLLDAPMMRTDKNLLLPGECHE